LEVIESIESYNKFIREYKNKTVFIYPILSDSEKHSCNNSLSLIYVKSIDNSDGIILSIDHTDSIPLHNFIFPQFKRVYTYDKKLLSNFINITEIIDLRVSCYLSINTAMYYCHKTKVHSFFQAFNIDNINRIIPLTKHFEMCEEMFEVIKDVINYEEVSFDFYNQIVIPNLLKIEESGLKVDKKIFQKYFKTNHLSNDDFIHTEYNIYTSTGRPSNRHGGINFASLNKANGSRQSFISRFDNGFILVFDYDGYHLRLISELVGYKFSKNESIHEYIGKQYFDSDKLTSDQYKKSKRLNFQYLYGGIPSSISDKIPYFKIVNDYIHNIWKVAKRDGYITSLLSKRKIYLDNIEDSNPQKLFNYFIQLLETERNMIILSSLFNFLKNYESKIILYAYDAFIFDLSPNDNRDFLIEVQNIIEQDGTFPTKQMIGRNYDEMINITDRF